MKPPPPYNHNHLGKPLFFSKCINVIMCPPKTVYDWCSRRKMQYFTTLPPL